MNRAAAVPLIATNSDDVGMIPKITAINSLPMLRSLREKKALKKVKAIQSQQDMHCGEIFVTNNARKWRFVCTYCGKSSSDIGEFVCHISRRHLDAELQDRADREEADDPAINLGYDSDNFINLMDINEIKCDDDFNDNEVSHDNDLLDYNDFLRVSMQTEAEQSNQFGKEERLTSSILDVKKAAGENNKKISITKKSQQMDGHSNLESLSTTTTANNQIKETNKRLCSNNDSAAEPETRKNTKCTNERTTEQTEDEYEDEDDDDDDAKSNGLLCIRKDMQIATTEVNSNKPIKENNRNSNSKRRQNRGPVSCQICHKSFLYFSLYRNHMLKHSNETPFSCIICQKGFRSKPALRYHVHTHQRDRRFRCQLCIASFHTESLLMTHMQTHEDANTHACLVCAKLFSTARERDAHVESHNTERPFRCNYCHKLFRLRHHLSNHVKSHGQYLCSFCRQPFNSTVQKHKPYACPTCEKESSTALNSENNIDAITDEAVHCSSSSKEIDSNDHEIQFKCNYCHKSYRHKNRLDHHMLSMHSKN